MIGVLIVGALAVAQPLQDADTSFDVRAGDVLSIRNTRGSILITSWNRDRVSITADFEDRGSVTARRRGSEIVVRTRARRGGNDTDIELMVPEWMELDIEGVMSDIEVRGSEGEIRASTTHGDIRVEGGQGFVELSSANGDVDVIDATARVRVETMNGEITLRRITGSVWVETVNGDVRIDSDGSEGAEVSSVNGDVVFSGPLSPDGDYSFTTHNGDVELTFDGAVNAEFTVSTARGEFETECPVRMTGTRSGGREFNFVVGAGSARVALESFGGTLSIGTSGGCW